MRDMFQAIRAAWRWWATARGLLVCITSWPQTRSHTVRRIGVSLSFWILLNELMMFTLRLLIIYIEILINWGSRQIWSTSHSHIIKEHNSRDTFKIQNLILTNRGSFMCGREFLWTTYLDCDFILSLSRQRSNPTPTCCYFWLRQGAQEMLIFVRLSDAKCSKAHNIHLYLSDQSQVSLRSVSGQSQVSLRTVSGLS